MNREKILEFAHRWCSRYRHGEEFPYWFNEYHLLEFVRRLHPAPEPTQDQEPIYQISLATGRVTSSAWIDVEKDQYDDAGLYPEYARRTLFLHPSPRPDFVRLSEEEIMEIVRSDDEFDEMMWDDTSIRFARAVENRLVEKNK